MLLAQNELNGSLPISFVQLFELVELDVSWNRFTGILSVQHFSKLSKLDDLWMEGNLGLVLNVSSTWILPFQVSFLIMGSFNFDPSFPTWLNFQKNLFDLDMSNYSISSCIPNWFWNISPLENLNLSSNQLHGQLPKLLNMTSLLAVDLSNNTLSGSIPPNIGESNLDLEFLSLSGNQITGEIHKSIGHMWKLELIDLSSNSLTGSIPSSTSNCSGLFFLNLGQNNLSGAIPKSFGLLKWLHSLYLNKNKLSGELPLSFQRLSNLVILDLSYNRLSDDIPT